MIQSVFTIIADLDPGGMDAVRAAIKAIHDDPAANALLPFGQFDNLHFASLVLAEGSGIDPSKLILECNIDGTIEAWLPVLVAKGGTGLAALFGGSPGFPAGTDTGARHAWLAAHVVHPGAYHIGATGRSLPRILQESQLHDAIEGFLDQQDEKGLLEGTTPAAVRSSIQAFVKADPALAWAQTPAGPNQTTSEKLVNVAKLIGTALVVVVLLPVLIPLLVIVIPVLLVKERTDPVQQGPAPPAFIRAVEADEDQPLVAQNHLASVIPVKPGVLRATLLPVVLFVLNRLVRVTGVNGELGGIPSIHFAHWSVINHGKHLLFVSNYDGSWESYLGDFVDKAAHGLTAVWSNTVNFPRTVLLILKGAANGPAFLQWGRASQCETGAWYTAYPHLTMNNVDNDSAVREGLFANDKDTLTWLQDL